MKVVVTGATGRVGRAICVRLLPHHEVVGIDRAPSSTVSAVLDLADSAALPRLRDTLRGADALIHVAALHAPQVGLVPDSEFQRINVDGTRQLAELCVQLGVPRLLFTSTTALYGAAATPVGRAGWVTEDTPPRPRTIYHRSKLAAEQLLEGVAAQGRLTVRVLRMSRCFPEPAPQMAVYRLHRGVDARDVATAHQRALAHDSPLPFRRWIISGSTPFLPEDVEALAADAAAVIRTRAPALAECFERRGWRLPTVIDRVYDSCRAMAELGWAPCHGPTEVLAQLDRVSSEVLPPVRERTGGG